MGNKSQSGNTTELTSKCHNKYNVLPDNLLLKIIALIFKLQKKEKNENYATVCLSLMEYAFLLSSIIFHWNHTKWKKYFAS